MSPRVVGLDLSIASTGWAKIRGGLIEGGLIESRPPASLIPRSRAWYGSSLDRISRLSREVCEVCADADLIVLEGLAPLARGNAVDRMFAMWWMVVDALSRDTGVPWAVVTPQQIKTYMTGKGNAPKDQVLAAVLSRFPGTVSGFDEADAKAAAAMGCDHLGLPLAEMPAKNRTTLAKVDWPRLLTAA